MRFLTKAIVHTQPESDETVLQFVITMILIIFFFWLFNMAKLNKSKNRSNITYNNNTFDNDSNHN
ncbi:hypothetical protein DERP_014796 [Dermatophagoides pteronyssinus]|uniref:Uncharacterized protein n=1 Tax=Dermatophagoides pteronyssinus TaxID=6956 RepID=A0ABQ8J307_DERPT|nr:hypothetical protein DERP_014796 [Dermatophagoides pteronyssinus]